MPINVHSTEYSGDERDQTRGMDLARFRERMAGIHTDPTTVMVARSPPDKCRQLAPKLEGCSIPARSALSTFKREMNIRQANVQAELNATPQ